MPEGGAFTHVDKSAIKSKTTSNQQLAACLADEFHNY